jgi:hypothetical protein
MYVTNMWSKRHYLVPLHGVSTAVLPLLKFQPSYNILIEFCMPMPLLRLLRMYLNVTYSKVRIHKLLSDTFHIQNVLKQGGALLPLLFNFALE